MTKLLFQIIILIGSLSMNFQQRLLAEEKFDSKQFASASEFSVLTSSKLFPNGTADKIVGKSAFATLTDEFFGGKVLALKIIFLPEALTEEGKADILTNDARASGKNGLAILLLFLDPQKKVWQVNFSFIVPGKTVVRTIASTESELKQFADYHYEGKRVKLKSKGSYTEPTSKADSVNLKWDVNIDLPVFERLKAKK